MNAEQRRRILERLNTPGTGITEEDRSAERQAAIERIIETLPLLGVACG
jgi:hypothetical protein